MFCMQDETMRFSYRGRLSIRRYVIGFLVLGHGFGLESAGFRQVDWRNDDCQPSLPTKRMTRYYLGGGQRSESAREWNAGGRLV